jgi:hypothetical protein
MRYIASIEDIPRNINHNAMMGFHLLLMTFLNKYGHDYQRTDVSKIRGLIEKRYGRMEHWSGVREYLERCRVSADFRSIVRTMNGSKKLLARRAGSIRGAI